MRNKRLHVPEVSLRGAKRRSNLCDGRVRKDCFVVALLLLAMTLSSAVVLAYDEVEANKVAQDMKDYGFKEVTTKEGLVFRIPSDMPIEKRAGMLSPVPFDEYLYIKFKKIEEKLIEVDKKLTDTDKKIDHLEETLTAIKKMMEKKESPSATPQF